MEATDTRPRAAIYARISEDRTGAGLGVGRQEEDCRALAERRGFLVSEVFTDNDISAYSGRQRPGYQRMLRVMAEGRIDVVLAWHADRLTRSLVELEEYINVSEKSGIGTIMVQSGEYDLSTSSGRMTARIIGAVSRQESEHKAERIRRKAQELAMAGKWTGGLRPFGWQIENGIPTLDADEAAVIRDAHSHVLAGLSLGSFIQQLAERGIKTSRGGSWSYATLRQMLLRPRNAGLAVWKGEIVGESEFPAIVERHIWEATRAILQDPGRKRSRTNKVKHLLAGIALCECLQPVKSGQVPDRKGDKHNIYRCSESGPGHVYKRMSHVDDHVERHILMFLAMAAHRAARTPVDTGVVSALRADEAAHRERLNEAARLFADGAIDGEQLSEMSRGIKAKLDSVRERLADLDAINARREQIDVPTNIDWADTSAAQEWYGLNIERKRAWIKEHFAIVLHRHAYGSARVFDPGSVQIIVRSSPHIEIPRTAVEQWKSMRSTWETSEPYGLMFQPSQDRELQEASKWSRSG